MTLRLSEIPKLSSELTPSILDQIRQSNTAKSIQKVKTNLTHLSQSQTDLQTPLTNQATTLAYNIVFDFLKSHNLNYTYNMLVSEGKFPLKDIVYPEDLRELLRLQETDKEARRHYIQKYTILDIMIERLNSISYERKDQSTQTLKVDDSVNVEEMFNRKYDAMKEEFAKIYSQQYQSKHRPPPVESTTASQLDRIKNELTIEFQQQYENRYKAKLKLLQNKQQMFKRKQADFLKQYTDKVEQTRQELTTLRKENASLKQRLKAALTQTSLHRCSSNKQYQKMVQQITSERSKLKQLQRKYTLALSHLNTKVQDIIAQKELIITDDKKFNIDKERRMRLDDATSRKLLESIRNLELRVDLLSKENMNQLKEGDRKSKHVLYLEKELKKTREELVEEESVARRLEEARGKKVETKSCGFNVRQEDILEATYVRKEEDSELQQQQIFSLIEESNKNRLNYLNSIDKIQIEMKFLKEKVRDLIQDDNQ